MHLSRQAVSREFLRGKFVIESSTDWQKKEFSLVILWMLICILLFIVTISLYLTWKCFDIANSFYDAFLKFVKMYAMLLKKSKTSLPIWVRIKAWKYPSLPMDCFLWLKKEIDTNNKCNLRICQNKYWVHFLAKHSMSHSCGMLKSFIYIFQVTVKWHSQYFIFPKYYTFSPYVDV